MSNGQISTEACDHLSHPPAVRLPILSISITVLSKPVFIGGVYAIPLSPSVSVDGDDVLKKQNQRSHTADSLIPNHLLQY